MSQYPEFSMNRGDGLNKKLLTYNRFMVQGSIYHTKHVGIVG